MPDAKMSLGQTVIPDAGDESSVDDANFDLLSSDSVQGDVTAQIAVRDQLVGTSLGKFEITQLLGRGGMGAVYKGHDPDLDRDVAIKVLSPNLSMNESARKRFAAEGRSQGKLSHPNVVAVHDVGEEAGALFLVMEFVTGGCVEDLLRGGRRVDPVRATEILADAAAGLSAAHDVGLIHRDMKPANLMLEADGTVKVADFGLAREPQSTDPRLTQASRIIGTPFFMSPEQCSGSEADARCDVYSLGATYHALLTGAAPFGGERSTMDILAAHLHEEPPPADQLVEDVPVSCTRLIARAMKKSVEDRYSSAEELLADAEALLEMLADPASSKTTTYRGATTCLRDDFALPSERSDTGDREGGGHKVSAERSKSATRPGGSSIIAALTRGRKTKTHAGTGSGTAVGPSAAESETPADSQPEPPAQGVTAVVRRAAGSQPSTGPVEHVVLPAVANPASDSVRREVFSVSGGEVVLICPKEIRADEVAEVRAWLNLIEKKITRTAAPEEGQAPATGGDAT